MYTAVLLRNSPKDRIYKHVQNENTSIFAMNLFPHFEHNTNGFIRFHLDITLNL